MGLFRGGAPGVLRGGAWLHGRRARGESRCARFPRAVEHWRGSAPGVGAEGSAGQGRGCTGGGLGGNLAGLDSPGCGVGVGERSGGGRRGFRGGGARLHGRRARGESRCARFPGRWGGGVLAPFRAGVTLPVIPSGAGPAPFPSSRAEPREVEQPSDLSSLRSPRHPEWSTPSPLVSSRAERPEVAKARDLPGESSASGTPCPAWVGIPSTRVLGREDMRQRKPAFAWPNVILSGVARSTTESKDLAPPARPG